MTLNKQLIKLNKNKTDQSSKQTHINTKKEYKFNLL